MGGYGSGRSSGQPTVESAFRIDIDVLISKLRRCGMMRRGRIPPLGISAGCVMRFSGCDVECEAHIDEHEPWNSWVRLKCRMTDYWTDEPLEIDDKIRLTTSRPPFGGLRWWFVCPRLNRKVRKLYLPLGSRHFWSRCAYGLAYASQRETVYDRAMRRARKLCLRLGGDPADDEYPDKPKRVRWTTYDRLMEKLVAADDVADERLVLFAARWRAARGRSLP
jgi:hypothetical protein